MIMRHSSGVKRNYACRTFLREELLDDGLAALLPNPDAQKTQAVILLQQRM